MGHISTFRTELFTEARVRFAKFLGVSIDGVDEQRFARTPTLPGATGEVAPRAGLSEVE